LGVYAAAIFTKRGSEETVKYALIGGFLTVLVSQPYVIGNLIDYKVDYSVMMLSGTLVAFFLMMREKSKDA
jgi:hypothetical protein